MNNTQQAGETAYLTREALRIELWSTLTDAAKKEMLPLKESYLDSLMADIDSYAARMQSTPFPRLSLKKGRKFTVADGAGIYVIRMVTISKCRETQQVMTKQLTYKESAAIMRFGTMPLPTRRFVSPREPKTG